jgi:hypothetical protein
VSPSGESFTVGTTAFSFPDIPMDVLDRLRPGAFVHVQFAKEGTENIVTSIWVHGPGRDSTAATWGRAPAEAAYLAANEAAMDKMMHDMTVQPSGDVDRDFVAMMAPHHQGVYLRYGKNEQLRRLAHEIIVTQRQEITVMRLAIGDNPTGDSNATHGSSQPATHQHHSHQ